MSPHAHARICSIAWRGRRSEGCTDSKRCRTCSAQAAAQKARSRWSESVSVPPRRMVMKRGSRSFGRITSCSLAAPSPSCVSSANHVQLARTVGLDRAHGLGNTGDMTIKRLDHVSVVVDDLAAAIAFFTVLGMTLEAEMPIDGPSADPVTELDTP